MDCLGDFDERSAQVGDGESGGLAWETAGAMRQQQRIAAVFGERARPEISGIRDD